MPRKPRDPSLPPPKRTGRPKGSPNRVPRMPCIRNRPFASEYLAATRATADGMAPLPPAEESERVARHFCAAVRMPSATLDEIEATPLVWAHGGSTRDADALVLRLRGGLRAVVVETRPATHPRARSAAEGPQGAVTDAPSPPEVVVALRVPFGSAMTPYGRDGASLAGQCGAVVGTGAAGDTTPPWGFDGVTLGPDAAVLWERVALPPGTPTPVPPDALRDALALALTRLLARVKHGETGPTRQARAVPYSLALRLTEKLGDAARFVPPNADATPEAHAQWVLAHALRALYGRNPAGAMWPFTEVGARTHRTRPVSMRNAEGYRSELLTVACELAVVVPPCAEGPTLAALSAEAAPGWGYVKHGGFDYLAQHHALAALLGHATANYDARNPSGALLCRAVAPHLRAGVPLPGLAARYGYAGGSHAMPAQGQPFTVRHRTAAGMYLAREGVPIDAQMLVPTGYGPVCEVTADTPLLRRSTRLDDHARTLGMLRVLGLTGEPTPSLAVGLVWQPFTYAVQHPGYPAVVVELDGRVIDDARRNAVTLPGATYEACRAALRHPMRRVRAIVDPDPRGAIADLERAVHAFVTWVLSADALALVPEALRTPAAVADFDVMARVFAATRPRMVVQWRCAEDHPAGVPTVALWCPIDPADATLWGRHEAWHDAGEVSAQARVRHALVALWGALTLGVGAAWGPGAEAAVLAALTAPPEPPGLDALGMAHAILDKTLRHRVAVRRAFQCDAMTTPHAPHGENTSALRTRAYAVLYPVLGPCRVSLELPKPVAHAARAWQRGLQRTLSCAAPHPEDAACVRANRDVLDLLAYPTGLDGVPAILPPAAGSYTDPEAPLHRHVLAGLGSATPTTGAHAAALRLGRVRAALWPLAPGTLPRRVARQHTVDPFPEVLPRAFTTGCHTRPDNVEISAEGAARRILERIGFRVTRESAARALPVVSPPWVGRLADTPREATHDAPRMVRWAVPMHDRPFVAASLNHYGDTLARCIADVLASAPPGLQRLAALGRDDAEIAAGNAATVDAERGSPPWVAGHVREGGQPPGLYEGEAGPYLGSAPGWQNPRRKPPA